MGNFNSATRMNRIVLPSLVKPAGGGAVSLQLPKTGLLARLYLIITGSVAGTLSAPNALGMASILRRVRLTVNSGVDIFNVSGAGYHYLLRNMHNAYFDPFPGSNARSAVTATTFNISMLIDVQVNQRDPIGLVMLQNEQTVLTLTCEFETDSVVATGATVTATVVPVMELFTVPQSQDNWPNLGLIHSVIEDQQAVSGAGDFTYVWPRGNTYLQILHGLGIGAAGSDAFSRARVRVNQSNFLEDYQTIPQALDMVYNINHPSTRIAGTIPIDYLGSAGLGTFGSTRDVIDSQRLTDVATVITATGAGTLYTLRRQLIPLGA